MSRQSGPRGHRAGRSGVESKSARDSIAFVFLLGAGHVVLGACNSILDNKPADLDDGQTTVTPTQPDNGAPAPTPSGEATASAPPPADTPVTSTPTPTPSGPTCAAGQHLCAGLCVRVDDPATGCGDPSCKPCTEAHASTTCRGNACAVDKCDANYADCNQNAADGCETNISLANSCGHCGTVCPPASPMCAPMAPGGAAGNFQCSTGCPATAPLLCGHECVSPLTSVNHCGSCPTKCPDVDQGTATCAAGLCSFTCKTGFHACNGRCAGNNDATACGTACTLCPIPANATAVCQSDSCGFTCNAGFGNCDLSAADGCEANLASDPLNCGACGVNCQGTACNKGKCAAPPPPPDAGAD